MQEQFHPEEVLNLAADAGQIILENGGETHRAEVTCNYICSFFHMAASDCFALPTGLMLTVRDSGGKSYTLVRRITIRTINLEKTAGIDKLLRDMEEHHTPGKAAGQIHRIRQLKGSGLLLSLVSSGSIAGLFCYLFGGTLYDSLFAVPIGLVIRLVFFILEKVRFNQFFNHVIGGLIAGVLAYTAGTFIYPVQEDKLIIGSIMLLVPGILIVNAIRDIIAGDLVAGITRLLEAFIISVAIAAGTGIALVLWKILAGGI